MKDLTNINSSSTSRIPFKVSARTAKLIGLENFSTEEGAVIELVKNTYDADAKNCIIIFDFKYTTKFLVDEDGNDYEQNVFDKSNSSIIILDNGIGMDDSIIANQWMTIGTDNKLYEHKTEGGRIKTGAKGIGRFALNRLGMLTDMLSVPVFEKEETSEKINYGYDWTVDWKDFDKIGATVSDVEAILIKRPNPEYKQKLLERFESYSKVCDIINSKNFDNGTLIEITELNDEWNEDKLNKLFINLEMLLPPEGQNDFNIDFLLVNNLELFGNIKRAYYDDFDYKVKASYNNQVIKVEITRNELDIDKLENFHHDVFVLGAMKNSPYSLEDFKKEIVQLEFPIDKLMSDNIDKDLISKIGKFDFTFYFLKIAISDDRDDGDIRKYPYKPISSANRRAWLKKFGGVKIFRDDFRIRPYGENGDDWLKLGERQAQSPGGAGQRLGGYRIRPYQIAGTIQISRIDNIFFQDKSGREGLIENAEFELFKNIIIEMINIFEKDRNVIMYHLSELYKIKNQEAERLRKAKKEAERIIRERQENELNKNNQHNHSKEGNNEEDEENANNQRNSNSEEALADGILLLEKENEKKDEEIRMLRSHASVGLIISSFAHELHNLKNRLIPRTKFLEDELLKYIDKKQFEGKSKYSDPFFLLELIKQEDLKLQHWLVYSLNSLKRDKRQRTTIDFTNYFESFYAIWKNVLIERKINLILDYDSNTKSTIRAFEVDLDCIFNNLLSNSLTALSKTKHEKTISITWRNIKENIEIYFSDNGKGLDSKYKDNPEQIFNLHESSKVDQYGNIIGTGLGLSMVKTIFSEYNNSTISISKIENGLTFKITFKLR